MTNYLVDWYIQIYISSYGKDTTYQDVILQFNMYLKRLVNTDLFSVFSDTVLAIGVVLLLFHFFSGMAEKSAAKQMSTLVMGRSFAALLAAVFILFHIKELFIFTLKMVESLNSSLSVSSSGAAIVTSFLSDEVVQILLDNCVSKHFGLADLIGYTLYAFVPYAVSLASKVAVMYFAATRTIQLFVYYVFAPIGVADIFESGPGGTVNLNSSGMRYLKTMAAIMLQLVVITAICQVYPTITNAVNTGFYEGLDEDDSSSAVLYKPLALEYTDHQGNIIDWFAGIWEDLDEYNNVKSAVNSLSDGEDGTESGTGGDSSDSSSTEELSEAEVYSLIKGSDGIINLSGTVLDEEKYNEIKEDGNSSVYRTTVASTQYFFDWPMGSDGKKTFMLCVLMLVKILLLFSSSKLCGHIVGISV